MANFDLKCPTSHIIFVRIAIGILYFLTGAIGSLVGVPGINVTPIWPPSGFALSAMLICGYAVWPGIFVGALLINFFNISNLDLSLHALTILGVSSMMALGASLQAAAGAWLIRHFIKAQHPFHRAIDVIKFSLIAIISCLINSNIGTLSLALSGIIPWSLYLYVWVTWWIGDIGGILVIAPLLLVWRLIPRGSVSVGEAIEMLALLVTIVIITILNLQIPDLVFLFIPCLIWVAFRFQLHGVTAVNLLISVIAVFLFALHGELVVTHSLIQTLIIFVIFVTVITTSILSLTAEISRQPRDAQCRWEGTSVTRSIKHFFRRWFTKNK